jgi:hypothetical protein
MDKFFSHGWTRINTDGYTFDLKLISVQNQGKIRHGKRIS